MHFKLKFNAGEILCNTVYFKNKEHPDKEWVEDIKLICLYIHKLEKRYIISKMVFGIKLLSNRAIMKHDIYP